MTMFNFLVKDKADDHLQAELITLAYRQSAPAAAIAVVVAIMVCAMLWPVVEHRRLYAWLVIVLVMAAARRILIGRFMKRMPQVPEILRWHDSLALSALATASIWGFGGLWLMPVDSLPHQIALYVIIIAMSSGAAAYFTAFPRWATLVVAAVLAPPTLWMLAAGTTLQFFVGVAGLIYFPSLLRSLFVASHTLRQSIRLADEIRQAHAEAEQRARTDELSQLPNRRAFFESGTQLCASAARLGHPVSLLMIDIDFFKRINDTYGHAAGDIAIATTARILREHRRQSDVAARIGGEEFVVLLPGTDPAAAAAVAEKLRALIAAETVAAGDQSFQMTASFGVAGATARHDLDTLLQNADTALYRAKQGGRNQVCIHSETAA